MFKHSTLCALCVIPFVVGSSSLLAHDSKPSQPQANNSSFDSQRFPSWKSSPLVAKVRAATERYKDIRSVLPGGEPGWIQGTPCVTGPNSGAMGVHYVRPDRLGDGVLSGDEPEALIYEPLPGGGFRLVGVEFITLASAWDFAKKGAPKLEGHLLHFVGEPNRYGLPAFYEMHVWAWEQNPDGNFVDWNVHVSCDKQPVD
jgi:hypothetical protein